MNRKKIHRYNIEGKFIQSYDTVKEAAQEFGVTATVIISAAKGRTQTSAGYRWSYIQQPRLLITKQPHEAKWKPVTRIDQETGEIKYYPSLISAAEDVWSHRQNVRNAIKNKVPHLGYLWSWTNES